MVKKIILFSLFFEILLLLSCGDKEKFPYDEAGLTFKNKLVYENQLKINGMYLFEDGSGKSAVNYFWRDGTFYEGGYSEISNDCKTIYSNSRTIPYFWGCYIIQGDELRIQTYDPLSLNGYSEYKVEELRAKILNDSTINFYQKISIYNKVESMNQTFKFKACQYKPDSTNLLMEN